ncbi:hypothetical protein L0P88_16915 [Muricauda sp. SCSIO 64092]|uniref:hypothetical protein n=1 Tax=Allomuricauda sp. SCSIO 64092 TaxID=2908842 RepID=UPI001FF6DCD6|nr:hypothetical protein [Muricauda sp. SCSIO 64092]UOY05623.1 hypothetical protein L0P88_16915 [Muricauda sp. SCSIO 64092]
MKIALVELSKSHEECIYSQVQFLISQGYKVDLYLNPKLEPQISEYGQDCNAVFFIEPRHNLPGKLLHAFQFAKTLGGYEKVIFNTASSSKLLRNTVILLKFYKVQCFGILHNIKRLESSFTQSLISIKIKKYFVLNDYLRKKASGNEKIHLQSFYPIYFPNFPYVLKKPKKEVWLVIPGSIDYYRRDYDSIIKALKKSGKVKNLKIILLGRINESSKDHGKLWESISNNNLQHYFVTFKSFIPNDVFHAYIKQADFIVPLLKLDSDYLTYKISGSFNLAFAYKKPLLSHKFFSAIPDIAANSIFYDSETLGHLLGSIKNIEIDPKDFYSDKKWDFDFQKEKYIAFLNTK